MTEFILQILAFFGIGWLFYISGYRDKRYAFTLWFPFTATSFIGTLFWLWSALVYLSVSHGNGEAAGWMAFGAAIALGVFLICPVILGISLWQYPKGGSYSLAKCLPILVIYFGLLASYKPLSHFIEDRQLRLLVLDTKMNPITHAKVHYKTYPRESGVSFPREGQIETEADGSVLLSVPKSHEIDCDIEAKDYAKIQIRMDKAWGKYTWHQTWVEWYFPPEDPKKPWEYHHGSVQTDVDDSNSMKLAVYMPRTVTETIPNYGPMRIYHEEQGRKWISEPSKINAY